MFAYLDPGSGALIWQMVLSVAAGILFAIWQVRQKVGMMVGWVQRISRNIGKAFRLPRARL